MVWLSATASFKFPSLSGFTRPSNTLNNTSLVPAATALWGSRLSTSWGIPMVIWEDSFPALSPEHAPSAIVSAAHTKVKRTFFPAFVFMCFSFLIWSLFSCTFRLRQLSAPKSCVGIHQRVFHREANSRAAKNRASSFPTPHLLYTGVNQIARFIFSFFQRPCAVRQKRYLRL